MDPALALRRALSAVGTEAVATLVAAEPWGCGWSERGVVSAPLSKGYVHTERKVGH